MVKNRSRQMIVIEKTIVFIELLSCLMVKELSFLKYVLLRNITSLRRSPETDQNMKKVEIAPSAIASASSRISRDAIPSFFESTMW